MGSGSNLQDGTVVRTHETRLGPDVLPGPHPNTVIGNNVTIGHQVLGRLCQVTPMHRSTCDMPMSIC